MKKASLILSSALLIGLLAGCGNSGNDAAAPTASPSNAPAEATATADAGAGAETGAYEDGTYYGTIPAEEGWQTYVLLTVEGGAIKTVDWNAFNVTNAGDLKKKVSEEGKYGMKEKGGAQAEWHEQAKIAEDFLIESQDPAALTYDAEGHTDAVSGVSVHVNDFIESVEAALAAGPVEAGPYKDGGYYAEGEMDANSGWKSTATVSVVNGNIVAAKFSGLNAAGEDKQQFSADGKYGMKEKGGAQAEWHEQAIAAQKYFVENQGAAPAFDAEGKTDAISGVSVHIDEYWNLAEQALEGAK